MSGTSTRTTASSREVPARVPVWISRVLALFAALALLGLVLYRWEPYATLTPALSLLALPSGPSLFTAALLLVLAGAIRRRFRAAHTALLAVMAFYTGYAIIELGFQLSGQMTGTTWRSQTLTGAIVLVDVLLLAVVAWARPSFAVRLRGVSVRNALVVLGLGLLLAFVVTLGLLSVVRDHDLGDRARWAFAAVFGVTTDPAVPDIGPAWLMAFSGLLSALAVLGGLAMLWRAHRQSALMSPDEELSVRAMLLEHGEEDSLGYFATRRDKAVVHSPDGRAAVAYRA